MRFKNYIFLCEQREQTSNKSKKVAVFAFGRFNPPTKGHEKLINTVSTKAKELDGKSFVFPSQTVDKKKNPDTSKNPLDWDTKIHFLKTLFPQTNIIKNPEVKSPHNVIEVLEQQGFTDVYFVVGSDRVPEFETRWLPYARDVFERAEIVSAGARDPDSEGISGMSASKAREAAKDGDIAKFRVATGWSGEVSTQLMNAVKKGMGVE
jgi:nicotinic acid mononucleotide adenylyltransferase